MFDEKAIVELLRGVKDGGISEKEALHTLKMLPYASLDTAKIDHHRALRRGFPEVICAMGKRPEDVASTFAEVAAHHEIVLCTRVEQEQVDAVREVVPTCQHDPIARALFLAPETITPRGRGTIAVVAAGTADLRVAQEAWLTATLMGNEVELILDVGIAGLHRLLGEMERIQKAEILIVVAGMEGALPSVLGSLCDRPILAVPVSVGYGTGEGGKAALLSMLNSCVPGIATLNIDNGFGAGYTASLMNRIR